MAIPNEEFIHIVQAIVFFFCIEISLCRHRFQTYRVYKSVLRNVIFCHTYPIYKSVFPMS